MSSIKTLFTSLLKCTINTLNPARLIRSHLTLIDNILNVSTQLKFSDESLSNTSDDFLIENVHVIAFGKAALGMSQTIECIFSERITSGIAIIPFNDARNLPRSDLTNEVFPSGSSNSKIRYFYGAEDNLPDVNSIKASTQVYEFCKSLKPNDLLICLISGGGSALLSLPVDIIGNKDNETNLRLKLETIKAIVSAGCNINQLNTVRSCLSMVKAGQLAEICQAKIISLIISDVIDDKLDVISSGPTLSVEKAEKFKKSIDLIRNYHLRDKIPSKVIEYLERNVNSINETQNQSNVYHYLIGNNKYATDSILNNELLSDYYKKNLTNSLQGEAKIIGAIYACLAFILIRKKDINELESIINNTDFLSISSAEISKSFGLLKLFLEQIEIVGSKKLCLISGGETTVKFNETNNSACKGGRNMEMTLAFEYVLNKLILLSKESETTEHELLFSSFGTDGIDGPTDSAGAYYQFDTANLVETDLDEMNAHLLSHNSYNYYSSKERLLLTGPTGTNVSDVQCLLIHFR